MKSFVVFAICLIGLVAGQQTRFRPNATHPDHPGKCYHKETNHVFEVDEVYKPVERDGCRKYTCLADNLILENWCSKYNVPIECVVEMGNPISPYPKCCDRLRCIRDGLVHVWSTSS